MSSNNSQLYVVVSVNGIHIRTDKYEEATEMAFKIARLGVKDVTIYQKEAIMVSETTHVLVRLPNE